MIVSQCSRPGGVAPTSDGLQESRPEGVQSGQHGSEANGAGRPDGDLGKDRRGRHKLDREVTSAKRDPTGQRRPEGTTLWGVAGTPARKGCAEDLGLRPGERLFPLMNPVTLVHGDQLSRFKLSSGIICQPENGVIRSKNGKSP